MMRTIVHEELGKMRGSKQSLRQSEVSSLTHTARASASDENEHAKGSPDSNSGSSSSGEKRVSFEETISSVAENHAHVGTDSSTTDSHYSEDAFESTTYTSQEGHN
jgi:hypothetical protein